MRGACSNTNSVVAGKICASFAAKKLLRGSEKGTRVAQAVREPANAVVAERSSLLVEVLLLEHAERALALHQAHVRRAEKVALEMEGAEAAGACRRCAQARSQQDARSACAGAATPGETAGRCQYAPPTAITIGYTSGRTQRVQAAI